MVVVFRKSANFLSTLYFLSISAKVQNALPSCGVGRWRNKELFEEAGFPHDRCGGLVYGNGWSLLE